MDERVKGTAWRKFYKRFETPPETGEEVLNFYPGSNGSWRENIRHRGGTEEETELSFLINTALMKMVVDRPDVRNSDRSTNFTLHSRGRREGYGVTCSTRMPKLLAAL